MLLLVLIFPWLTLSPSLLLIPHADPFSNPPSLHLKLLSKQESPAWLLHNFTVIQSLLPCLAQLTLRPLLSTPFSHSHSTLRSTTTKSTHLIHLLQKTSPPTPLPLLLDHCYTLASTSHPNATTALRSALNPIPPGMILPYNSALHFILAIDCQESQFINGNGNAVCYIVLSASLKTIFLLSPHVLIRLPFLLILQIPDSPLKKFFQNGHAVSIFSF